MIWPNLFKLWFFLQADIHCHGAAGMEAAARWRIYWVGIINRRMQLPTVIFSQPDSPTNPKVSQSRMLKLTARIQATTRCKIPPHKG